MSPRTWCVLFLMFAVACRSSPTSPSPDLSPAVQSDQTCGARIDAICAQGQCTMMGTHYPATLAGWCAYLKNFPQGVQTSGGPAAACNGWTLVRAPNGDQPIDLYYDSSGAIVAIMYSMSQPPCLGACAYACAAGPADVKPTQLAGCQAASPASDLCAVDASTKD